jgi:phosphatidylglycerol:prolipoprotein diacylglycerol transferase
MPLGYIVINLDPVFITIGNLAIHWYGLAYVVAISVGLWFLLRWTRGQGIHDDQTWSLFLWAAIAGLIGGRLYFVIQQPDLLTNYIERPLNIFKVWNGGMAFFGAIFLGTATLFYLAPRYGLDRFLVIDGGALFAVIGQIFGRFGNIVNGDITGQALASAPIAIPGNTCANAPCVAYVSDPHYAPWAFVYLNPHSFAVQGIPFQPAPLFEILANLVALAILWNLRFSLPRRRAGLFFTCYLALYAIGQFVVFFFRGSEPITPFLGITAFKQAQWTAIITLLACVPIYLIVRRYGRPWRYSAKNPVPWPIGVATAGGAATTLATSTARSMMRAAARPVAVVRPSLDDLPPWTPTHATHGQLRNVFVRVASASGRDAG